MRPIRSRAHRYGLLSLSLAIVLSSPAQALFGLGKSGDSSGTAEQETDTVPIAQELEITTYRDIPYAAQFLAAGGGGEPLTFEIVDEPTRGTVTVEGDQFVYTPQSGKCGKDSFTYTAVDTEGNVSQPATVRIKIEKPRSGISYEDTDSRTAAAAQYLAECGAFIGTQIGDRCYFEPERTVNRSEFLALTMETLGLEADTVSVTGFCDDEAIPTWAKSYAASGLAEGIVKGVSTADGVAFQGERAISGEEAAVILNRVLASADVDLAAWYGDSGAVPAWAAQAVGNLEALSVLDAGSFGSGVADTVTRGDAARMLTSAAALLEERESSGLLDWLGA